MTTADAPVPLDIPDGVVCPVCSYSLRGLTRPQCPECGGPFDLQLLLDRERAGHHGRLFEHGPRVSVRRYLWTLWKSLWCGPLWRRIDPAHEIRVGRLGVYLLVSSTLAGVMLLFGPTLLWEAGRWLIEFPRGRTLAATWWNNRYWGWGSASYEIYQFGQVLGTALQLGPLLLWAPLSLVSLGIFRESLGRAKVRPQQLFRSVVYSADAVLLLTIAVCVAVVVAALIYHSAAAGLANGPPAYGQSVVAGTYLLPIAWLALCAFRLAWAARIYLGVRGLVVDVLLSQLVVGIAILTMLTLTGWAKDVMLAFT